VGDRAAAATLYRGRGEFLMLVRISVTISLDGATNLLDMMAALQAEGVTILRWDRDERTLGGYVEDWAIDRIAHLPGVQNVTNDGEITFLDSRDTS
jgi:hypothetical protein